MNINEMPLSQVSELQATCDIVTSYERLVEALRRNTEQASLALGVLQKKQDPEFTTPGEYALFDACRKIAVEGVHG